MLKEWQDPLTVCVSVVEKLDEHHYNFWMSVTIAEVYQMEPDQSVKDEMDVDNTSDMTRGPRKMCAYSQNGATAWVLPVDMFSEIQPEITLGERGSGWYAKRCRVLAKNWKTKDSRDWLPAKVVDYTFYSLSLLSALAHLSSITKGDRNTAHDTLLQARQRRIEESPLGGRYVSTVIDDLAYEPLITECTTGLMLQDVVEALDVLYKAKEDAKAQRLEQRAAKNSANRMAKAADRATERRKNKVRFDTQLQQSLWKEQAGGGVELVGMEYSQEPHQTGTHTAGGGHATWHDLKKQAQDSARQGREAERRRTESINQQPAQQVFRSIAAQRARGGRKRRQVRASDMKQLVQDLNDDDDDNDESWDDTDDEADAIDLESTMDQEPSDHNVWVNQSKNKQKQVNRLVNDVQSKSKVKPSASTRAVVDRDDEQRERDHLAWKKSVHERSQRLPNEVMDFSTLGKLQSTTEKAEMTDMTDALISMMEGSEKAT